MKSLKSLYKAYAVAAIISLSAMPAKSAIIEMALVLDGSGSMGYNGFEQQKDAYQNIFSSGTFYDDFLISGDQLYVSSWQFSTNIQLEQDWFLIEDNATASVFGATFADIEWLGGWTNTALAINTISTDMLNNTINGDELVINISTDGYPCTPDECPQNFADSINGATAAANNGIVLNAIGLGNGVDENFLSLITEPSGGSYESSVDFTAFQSTLEDSLFRDINSVSEPGMLALFGLFIVGIAAKRRRKA